MIEWMVIAAPRSGTTWAANWLTTEDCLTLHDPLWQHHYTELDEVKTRKRLGVACSGLAMFPDWVNAHPARKLVLHRDIEEVNGSLREIGLPVVAADFENRLDKIHGMHAEWTDLFANPAPLYEFLLKKEFDAERHSELKKMFIQPNFEMLPINKEVTKRLMEELQQCLA